MFHPNLGVFALQCNFCLFLPNILLRARTQKKGRTRNLMPFLKSSNFQVSRIIHAKTTVTVLRFNCSFLRSNTHAHRNLFEIFVF